MLSLIIKNNLKLKAPREDAFKKKLKLWLERGSSKNKCCMTKGGSSDTPQKYDVNNELLPNPGLTIIFCQTNIYQLPVQKKGII